MPNDMSTGDPIVDRQLRTRQAKDIASTKLALSRAGLPDVETLTGLQNTVKAQQARLEALERKADRVKADITVRQIDVSNSATLVMVNADDTAPAMNPEGTPDAVTAESSVDVSDAAGTTPASEARSVLQTNGQALRLISPVTFGMARQRGVYQLGPVEW